MTRGLGPFGEAWAAALLSRRGYRILERNVRFRSGEIDIVAQDGEERVFVEVKTRRTGRFGLPEEAITPRKFERLARAAAEYLQERGLQDAGYRIDVVALELDASGRVRRYSVIRNVEAPE